MLLYSLVAETIGTGIEKDPQITGFVLPGGKRVKRMQHADGTNSIHMTVKSINACLHLFQHNEDASGARIKHRKSRGLSVMPLRDGELEGLDGDIKWNGETCIMGIHFTKDLTTSSRMNWSKIQVKLKKRLALLTERNLSLRGRAILLNSLILSKGWHVGRVFLPPPDIARKIMKMIFRYMWKGGHEIVSRENVHKPVLKGGLGLLHVFRQCVALQLNDLNRLKNDHRPFWGDLVRFWGAVPLRGLLPRWSSLHNEPGPTHILGKKPLHHGLLFEQARTLCSRITDPNRDPPVREIRGLLEVNKANTPKDLGSFSREVGHDVDWRKWPRRTFSLVLPPLAKNSAFLLYHRALKTKVNLAKWFRNNSSMNVGCHLCGLIDWLNETSIIYIRRLIGCCKQ